MMPWGSGFFGGPKAKRASDASPKQDSSLDSQEEAVPSTDKKCIPSPLSSPLVHIHSLIPHYPVDSIGLGPSVTDSACVAAAKPVQTTPLVSRILERVFLSPFSKSIPSSSSHGHKTDTDSSSLKQETTLKTDPIATDLKSPDRVVLNVQRDDSSSNIHSFQHVYDARDPVLDRHHSDSSSSDDRFSLSDSEDEGSSTSDDSQEEDDDPPILPVSPNYIHDLTERVEKNKRRNAERLRALGLMHSTHVPSTTAALELPSSKVNKKKRSSKTDVETTVSRKRPRGMLFSTTTITSHGGIEQKQSIPNLDNTRVGPRSIIQIMEEKYPHRSSQIRLLSCMFESSIRLATTTTTTHSTPSPTPFVDTEMYVPAPLLITGPKATGKTSIIRDLLGHLKDKAYDSSVRIGIAYVDLEIMESRTIPSLLDEIYHQLATSLSSGKMRHRKKHKDTTTEKTIDSLDPRYDESLDDDHDIENFSLSEDEIDYTQEDEDIIEKARGTGLSRKRRSSTLHYGKSKGAPTSKDWNSPSIPNAMSLGRALSRLMGKSPLGPASLSGCAFVTLDNVENIFSLAHRKHRDFYKGVNERNNLLSQLLLLPQVLGLNITFILVSRHLLLSHSRVNNYQNAVMALGSIGDNICPIHVHFHAYRGTELRNILLLPRLQEWITGTHPACVNAEIQSTAYKSMIETMIQTMENITRDMSEFSRLCRFLWPVYLSMLSKNASINLSKILPGENVFPEPSNPLQSRDISGILSSSMESIHKHIRQLMSVCLPIAGQGYNPESLDERGYTRMMEDKTAYLTKFLLLAAFICQRNKSDHDEVLFTDKSRGKKSKRSKDALDDNIAFATSAQTQLDLKTVRVPSFPLERMLSVFSSIVSKYGRGIGNSMSENDEVKNMTADIGTFAFFQGISQLRQVNLLLSSESIHHDRLLANFTCTLCMDDAKKIAQEVNFPLKDYLSDEKL